MDGKIKKPDTINGRRSEILRHCMDMGTQEKGMFRLTVPTGGGKTIASLAFALRHAAAHQMKRIIYVIPYTNIIEQNAQVFREILGEENVLESHCNIDYTSSEELRPMQLASENWDKPVVVTTNVQFFESLFANKSSKCRKLHNIANSVIIFDEAQMLPNDYLKPCTAAMEELLANYRTSMVLCTATQPALDPFFKGRTAVELCPRKEEQFRFLRGRFFRISGPLQKTIWWKGWKKSTRHCALSIQESGRRQCTADWEARCLPCSQRRCIRCTDAAYWTRSERDSRQGSGVSWSPPAWWKQGWILISGPYTGSLPELIP